MKEVKNYIDGLLSATYTKGYGKFKRSFRVFYYGNGDKFEADKDKYEATGWVCWPYYEAGSTTLIKASRVGGGE